MLRRFSETHGLRSEGKDISKNDITVALAQRDTPFGRYEKCLITGFQLVVAKKLKKKMGGVGPIKEIPLTSMRKTIIKFLSSSERNTLRVTMTTEVDMSRAVKLRKKLIQEERRIRISYTNLIVKATIDALKQNLLLNSRLEGETIKIFEKIHIGIAVSVKSGLIVPVIRDAGENTLLEIALTMDDLVKKARSGKLTLGEVTGGTFTITNLGVLGVDIFTPIITPPQSAILAIGRIAEKPVVVKGDIVARHMMPVSLSFDHRIIDGVDAAKFLRKVKELLESL